MSGLETKADAFDITSPSSAPVQSSRSQKNKKSSDDDNDRRVQQREEGQAIVRPDFFEYGSDAVFNGENEYRTNLFLVRGDFPAKVLVEGITSRCVYNPRLSMKTSPDKVDAGKETIKPGDPVFIVCSGDENVGKAIVSFDDFEEDKLKDDDNKRIIAFNGFCPSTVSVGPNTHAAIPISVVRKGLTTTRYTGSRYICPGTYLQIMAASDRSSVLQVDAYCPNGRRVGIMAPATEQPSVISQSYREDDVDDINFYSIVCQSFSYCSGMNMSPAHVVVV